MTSHAQPVDVIPERSGLDTMATRPFISRDNSLDGVPPDDDPQHALRTRRCPVEFSRRVDPVEYRVSAAARAFKSHALTAAG